MPSLEKLTALLDREPDDPFLRYSVAMEHKKAGRVDEAAAWFDKTLEVDPAYCYAHYHKAQALEDDGREDQARAAYEAGIAAAKEHGDAKALGELQAALDIL